MTNESYNGCLVYSCSVEVEGIDPSGFRATPAMLADIMSQAKWPELWPTNDDDAWGQLPRVPAT